MHKVIDEIVDGLDFHNVDPASYALLMITHVGELSKSVAFELDCRGEIMVVFSSLVIMSKLVDVDIKKIVDVPLPPKELSIEWDMVALTDAITCICMEEEDTLLYFGVAVGFLKLICVRLGFTLESVLNESN